MKQTILAALSAAFLITGPAGASDLRSVLTDLATTDLSGWLADDGLIDALRAQNADHAALAQADIDAMDQTWRAEIGAADTPMITEVLGRAASAYLRDRKEATNGLVTEVFLMDNLGLNVAQSDLTSDYWQGDEDKFQRTYGAGTGSIHISDVELDESTGTYQSQVSMVVTDPGTGAPIGAITFGVNVDYLN